MASLLLRLSCQVRLASHAPHWPCHFLTLLVAVLMVGCSTKSLDGRSSIPHSSNADVEAAQRELARQEYESRIMNDPAYIAIKRLLDQPICTNVRYYGHLSPSAGYIPIPYGRNQEFTFMSPQDMPGEFEEKWAADPQYKQVCFTPDQDYWSPPESPSEFLISVKDSRDSSSSAVLMLRDKEARSRVYVDCRIGKFRDSYQRDNTSNTWSHKTIDPFISVGLTELDLICKDPGVKAISDGKVFSLLR